ncbi:MAG: EAL domain-containing protein [Burkholderiales bacterium]|nr:EAL domain-containing protein [Burkholderiales bacterium]MDE2396502.1 EAL domain-containing protein [Burkholderiales bacterium]
MQLFTPLTGIARSSVARALRYALPWLLPYLMVGSAFTLAGLSIPRDSAAAPLGAFLLAAAARMRELMPIVIWGSIGAMQALQRHLPRATIAFVCVGSGAIVEAFVRQHCGAAADAVLIPLSLLAPFGVVAVTARVGRIRWLRLAGAHEAAGQNVGDSLNFVFPALIAAAGLVGALYGGAALARALPWPSLAAWAGRLSPLELALAYTASNSVLWSAGVNGYYALLPLLERMPQALGGGLQAINPAFLGAYVFIGGSGASLALALALLLGSRLHRHRFIALVSLVPALFNLNELLLFGLPLILNGRLLLPFVLAPVANLGLAALALHEGWIRNVAADLPFNSPVVLNALIVGGGDRAALLLQGGNLLVGVLIYLPFVLAWERTLRQDSALEVKTLDTEYRQRLEEAAVELDDPVGLFRRELGANADLRGRLASLDAMDFVVHYQPKLERDGRFVVGGEALLRLDDGEGRILTPGQFLPDLERAHLSRQVDLWVMNAVVRQLSEWKASGTPLLPVAVNVGPESLLDRVVVAELAELARHHPGMLSFEITENSLIRDEATVRHALGSLRSAGATVQIDDFGTGYSSLSYLHRFDVDGIKIDRSFTAALDHPKGCDVFRELCALALRLDLDVVVEGVEQAWQLEHLPADPRVVVQGWLFAPALPAAGYVEYVRQRNGAYVAAAGGLEPVAAK